MPSKYAALRGFRKVFRSCDEYWRDTLPPLVYDILLPAVISSPLILLSFVPSFRSFFCPYGDCPGLLGLVPPYLFATGVYTAFGIGGLEPMRQTKSLTRWRGNFLIGAIYIMAAIALAIADR